MVGERSGLTNQFLHPPTAGDSLELEMKYVPIKLSTDFFTCPGFFPNESIIQSNSFIVVRNYDSPIIQSHFFRGRQE